MKTNTLSARKTIHLLLLLMLFTATCFLYTRSQSSGSVQKHVPYDSILRAPHFHSEQIFKEVIDNNKSKTPALSNGLTKLKKI